MLAKGKIQLFSYQRYHYTLNAHRDEVEHLGYAEE